MTEISMAHSQRLVLVWADRALDSNSPKEAERSVAVFAEFLRLSPTELSRCVREVLLPEISRVFLKPNVTSECLAHLIPWLVGLSAPWGSRSRIFEETPNANNDAANPSLGPAAMTMDEVKAWFVRGRHRRSGG